MKFINDLNPNEASRFYIVGIIVAVVALFLITGVVFLMLVANKFNIIMSQPAGDTYTYFIAIMDRILAILAVFVVLPLTLYQICSKNKSKIDNIISLVALLILFAFVGVFFSGEYFFFKKYSEGKLNNSKLFCEKMIEMKVFNRILIMQNVQLPKMSESL